MKNYGLLLCSIFLNISLQAQRIPIEKGVSITLASYRKKTVSDIHYELNLTIPADKTQSIPAMEQLIFTLKTNTQPLQIDFRADKSQVEKVKVNGKRIAIALTNEHLVIQPAYLHKGKNRIEILFVAGDLSLNRNSNFLYTLLVPDRARTLFPCFDQPDLKARFDLTLSIPKEWQALANGAVKDSVIQSDKKTFCFNTSDLISTYLFSFSAGNFKSDFQEHNRPMHFLFRETDSAKIRLSLDSIFKLHIYAIRFLESYTQINYPFQKLDFVAIPDFQYGGMEHVGAIDYKAAALFLDAGATKEQLNARNNLISHETAHMWFGDLVTMKWFNDVWMKEVFANFMADKITQGNAGNYELRFLTTHLPRAYSIDRTPGANSIRQPLANLQEAGTLYGPIIYDKAPVMMRQLERLMGHDAFRDGLRQYLKKFSYGNASWPDLISILDARTPVDLQSWNRVWVNTPGRPLINYSLKQSNHKITSFIINQKGEFSNRYLLPQYFEVLFIYPDHQEEYTIHLNREQQEITELRNKQVPDLILFNSSGQGYGLFPVDNHLLNNISQIQKWSALQRAALYINLYENMLSGNYVTPEQLLLWYRSMLIGEEEELNMSLLAGHITDIFWRLISPTKRLAVAAQWESILWKAISSVNTPNKKKILFRTIQSISLSAESQEELYRIWKTKTPPEDIRLNEEEYTSLAINLILKDYPDSTILQQQYNRLTNADRKARLQFLMPAVSKDSRERDRFFQSLSNISIRKKESWVADALSYLHHPLRSGTSIKFLRQSLEMLEEIQRTGDIFFPGTWLANTFGNYQSKEAADIVRQFLKEHPDYNSRLKAKVLQATDPLMRAEKLVTQ